MSLNNRLVSELDMGLNSCILSINAKFASQLSSAVNVKGGTYLYNRIEQDCYESMIDENTSQVFHVIPSGDGVNSIIIAQLNDRFMEVLAQDKNSSEIFYELYPVNKKINFFKKKLENRKHNETESSVIWVPCFSLDSDFSIASPHLMSDVHIQKEEKDYRISHLHESKQFSFIEDRDFDKGLKMTLQDGDILIDGTFMICIANLDILTELNIPSIFLQIVTQDKWTKLN
jgi:hypothetical protein